MLPHYKEVAFYSSSAECEIWKRRKGSVPQCYSDERQHGAVLLWHRTPSSSLCSKKGPDTTPVCDELFYY